MCRHRHVERANWPADGETQQLNGDLLTDGTAAQRWRGHCAAGRGFPWWALWLIWPVALAVKGLAALPVFGAALALWQMLAGPLLLVVCGVLIGVGLMLVGRERRRD